MIKIGVCGIAGSGKSTFCRLFESDGGMVVDLDRVGHGFYSDVNGEVYREILSAFGDKVLGLVSPDGSINRKALGTLVFSDKAELARLNLIFYERFYEYIKNLIFSVEGRGPKYFVLDAAVLFDCGLDRLMDVNIWVDVPETVAVARLVEKRKITPDYAASLVAGQLKNFRKYRDRCGHVVPNDLGPKELRVAYGELMRKLRAGSSGSFAG